jgi:serine protease Do
VATKNKNETPGSYSVSSRAASKSRDGINISFTVPTLNLKKPSFNKLRNPKVWGIRTLVLAYIITALFFGYIGALIENHGTSIGGVTYASLNGQKKIVTSQSQLINQIAKTVGPSVVSVNVSITSTSSSSDDSNSDFGGLFGFSQPQQEEQEQAAGTGIILTSDGLIVTNRHVVPDGTTSVSVTLSNGTELKDVSVVGRTNSDSSLDIAFLKINNLEGQKLTPAVIGDSSQVQIGDSVVAIGNALGQFQNTVTSGIISGYGRSVEASDSTGSSSEDLDDLFQTDAAINEGNSGGPLVNMNGQVIGINVATASGAENIGFSIPINDVKGLISQVTKTGKFAVPYLGVKYIPITADVAAEYNLSVDNGAFIAPSSDPTQPSVISGSPADSAGLQTNDIITAVNGTNIDQEHSLTALLDQFTPGTKINLTVIRGGKTINISATLGSQPSN